MVFYKWKNWALILLWVHIGSLLVNGAVYSLISIKMHVPFHEIFNYPETAPYYLAVYAFTLLFSLSLGLLGLVLGDIFGHKDLRAQVVSRGMLMIGIISAFLPLGLITVWDLALHFGEEVWEPLALAAQHLGIWITLVSVTFYAGVMVLIFYLAKENASIPNGWAGLSLFLGCAGFVIALLTFWIAEWIVLFRILYLVSSVAYLVWGIWLAAFMKRIERLP